MSLVLFKVVVCLVVIFWSPWVSLADHSHSSFALVVSYVQVWNCFLFPVMLTRVVSGKSKPIRIGLRTGPSGLEH
jgi:Na+-driven multidrug efflux pump